MNNQWQKKDRSDFVEVKSLGVPFISFKFYVEYMDVLLLLALDIAIGVIKMPMIN